MRITVAILLFSTWFFVGIDCYAQDPCSVRFVTTKPSEKSYTAPELVHRNMLQTPPRDLTRLAFGDVEFILKCGSSEDAAEFFAAIRDTSIQMDGATVVEAGRDFVRVSWDDGFEPNLTAFRFNFDKPLNTIPHPSEKVLISGTYSSYSREPFQINLTNSTFILAQPRK